MHVLDFSMFKRIAFKFPSGHWQQSVQCLKLLHAPHGSDAADMFTCTTGTTGTTGLRPDVVTFSCLAA